MAHSMQEYVLKAAKCELLGPFAILVQSTLGALAILSLFYKRHIEKPRRPLQIWLFDVSKQLFGAFVVHFLNIAMSSDPDLGRSTSPCTWYFLNVLLDTTVGVGVLWVVLRTLDSVCILGNLTGTKSGVYGTPPKWSWWLKQSAIYTVGLSLMKTFVFVMLTVVPQLGPIGNFLLRWSEQHEKARIIFVMFIFPLIMNIVQYIIIDNIVMSRASAEGDTDTSPVKADNDHDGDDDERTRLLE